METIEPKPLKPFPPVAPLDPQPGPGPGRMTECAGEGALGGVAPAAGPAHQDQAGHDRDQGLGRFGIPDPEPSMLDDNYTYCKTFDRKEAPNWNELTPAARRIKAKKGRYYHCLCSGMLWHRKDHQYFLTLTTSAESEKKVTDAFRHFQMVIRYTTPDLLVKGDYMTRCEALKWYPLNTWEQPIKFDYCRLHTSEGLGVLHIVFAGTRLPISYIRSVWTRIHNAPQIVIRHIERDDDAVRKLKNYLMKQYLYGQDGFVRYSCSGDWIYPSYRRDWESLKNKYDYHTARTIWDQAMYLHQAPGQYALDGLPVTVLDKLKRFQEVNYEK